MQSEVPRVAKGQGDLIDRFADVVLEADHPRRLAERTLKIALLVSHAAGAATFVREGDNVTLYTYENVDQGVVDAARTVWSRSRESLQKGEVLQLKAVAADQPSTQESRPEQDPVERVVVPILDGDVLVGLLYLEGPYRSFRGQHHATLLTKLSRFLGKTISSSRLA